MPWRETCPMDERVQFIREYQRQQRTFRELCLAYGISRQNAYKWVRRFEQGGLPALVDLPRVAHHHPHGVKPEVAERIVALRQEYPKWGPRILCEILRRQDPSTSWPSPSTVSEMLRKRGLARPRKKRIRRDDYTSPVAGYYGPNAQWCVDFKGTMQMLRGSCDPFTLSDGFSRFILAIRALSALSTPCVKVVFRRAFCEFGLPDAIRSDNGPPFGSQAPGRLTQLSIWWVKLGIVPILGRPGKPQDNGRHERMHRTLKHELAECIQVSREPNSDFERFRDQFNYERPHQALDMKCPAQVYAPSSKPYPRPLRDPSYPQGFWAERLTAQGCLWWIGQSFYLAKGLSAELVGIKLADDDTYKIYFGPVFLGSVAPAFLGAGLKRRTKRRFRLAS